MAMPTFKKKYKKSNAHVYYRSNRTGEDIDMLHERELDGDRYSAGSDSYKNHIDGA
jgi:hypothetical protein